MMPSYIYKDVLYRRPVSLVAAFPAISFDSHAGYDRHSWPQQMFRILTFLEDDLHWESLYYLYIIACGILGRQQTVAGSARAGKIQNVTIVDAAVGVNKDFDGLAGPHVRQLCFFEISGDPDIGAVQRNDRHQLLARRDVLAWLDRSLSDDPADWRDNRCVLQVQLDLLKIRGGDLNVGCRDSFFGIADRRCDWPEELRRLNSVFSRIRSKHDGRINFVIDVDQPASVDGLVKRVRYDQCEWLAS